MNPIPPDMVRAALFRAMRMMREARRKALNARHGARLLREAQEKRERKQARRLEIVGYGGFRDYDLDPFVISFAA